LIFIKKFGDEEDNGSFSLKFESVIKNFV